MAIPGNFKISESGGGNERAGFTRFHGKMVYRIPQSAVETYRNDFTPGLLTGGVTATASSVTASGVVTTYTAAFSNTHVGNPISLGAYGTYYISSYSSSIKVDTTFSTAGAALGTTAVSVNTQKLWPGRTDLLAPRLTEYNLEPQYPGVAGMSRVTMYYNTPSIHQLVTESTARAVLSIEPGGVEEKLERERVQGRSAASQGIITGVDYEISGDIPTHWEVTRGTNQAWRPGLTFLKLTTAARTFDVQTMLGLIGKVNQYPLPNFGNCGTGTVMFLYPKAGMQLPLSSYYMVEYYFAYDPGETDRKPWHCTTTPFIYGAMEVPIIDTAGVVQSGGDVARIPVRLSKDKFAKLPTSADRTLARGSADFRDLDARLTWLNGL